MFFLISFIWLVAASFAFVLAILTPFWLSFSITDSSGTVTVVQRGIFYICDVLQSNNTYQTTRCVSIIQQGSSPEPNKWTYQYAIATASLAIACAGLSIIAIWFSGIYFQARRRTKQALCSLLSISILILLTFCTSFIVWILLISDTLRLGFSVDRNVFSWPMWLAVGATGGYLMSFISMLFSYCAIRRRQSTMDENYNHPRNKF